ncbi:hypothetical protein CCMA1212_004412 [Trichoderma ghanense]|uniref:Uncharacterized protein n=1 Tax=Trichoderma ghanense TaxID=65468 RepID=A0ABY2H4I0_9HYPO
MASKQKPFRIVGLGSLALPRRGQSKETGEERRLGASSGCSRKEALVVGPCGRLEPVLHRAMQSLAQDKGAAAGASRGEDRDKEREERRGGGNSGEADRRCSRMEMDHGEGMCCAGLDFSWCCWSM